MENKWILFCVEVTAHMGYAKKMTGYTLHFSIFLHGCARVIVWGMRLPARSLFNNEILQGGLFL